MTTPKGSETPVRPHQKTEKEVVMSMGAEEKNKDVERREDITEEERKFVRTFIASNDLKVVTPNDMMRAYWKTFGLASEGKEAAVKRFAKTTILEPKQDECKIERERQEAKKKIEGQRKTPETKHAYYRRQRNRVRARYRDTGTEGIVPTSHGARYA